MIEVVGVSRTYKAKRGQPAVSALTDVSFTVRRGELFGVLGPNGAGKTTLIRILSTLLMPSKGTALIGGVDVTTNPKQVRPRIGVVFGGDRGLYERLTAFDNLRFSAELYGLPIRSRAELIDSVLRRVGLEDKSRVRVETFSRGMRQRLHIARALLHRPDMLFLDEPSNGLDPVAARELRALVRELADGGTTIILTTHFMFEADELCDRLAIIVGGKVVTIGAPSDVKSLSEAGISFEVSAHEPLEELITQLVEAGHLDSAQSRDAGELVHWTLRGVAAGTLTRVALANALGIESHRVLERAPTLEDAYVALVSRASKL